MTNYTPQQLDEIKQQSEFDQRSELVIEQILDILNDFPDCNIRDYMNALTERIDAETT